ncbi:MULTISPECIES: TetR/AcrR family transcriptional regulator [Streptomyces violaceusniger group]|uniref:TetR/AcrR family transcriptional regulator n=1 Tax=Streptomyces violaceusniger group TaxID=2839105 RepID=UPI001FCA09D8|nr:MULTISPECIES: TetR/AcrR family transcriptional regulator [Streptomyces violaceusniger group]
MTAGDPAPVRRRNPRGQGQVLRAQLIEAAAHLLATLDQPETLTLRRVAREVGVAPASIYSHFPDLGALIDHVLCQRYEELARLMDRAEASATDPLGALVARCAAYVRWGVEQPGHYRTLFGGRMPRDLAPRPDATTGTGAEAEAYGDSVHEAGAGLLEALIAALAAVTGTPDAPERRWQAGLLLWTAMHGLISLYNDHGDLPWPPLDDLLADLIALHTARSAKEIADVLARGTAQSLTAAP